MPTAHLVDASIYIFRAWFSIPDTMCDDHGQPVNAVYGFTRFLTEFVEKSQATHIAVAFDESLTRSFRNELYPPYKANRELPPQQLVNQFQLCRRVAEAAGLYCVSHSRYEADDLIATLAAGVREQGFDNVIVSGDKDLTQIIRNDDLFWDFARNRQHDVASITRKFGVPPQTIQELLGLTGDSVDNIPGVPGVGPKTATALLQAFGDLETIYDNLDEVAGLPIRGATRLPDKLDLHRHKALLSRQLATVVYDAPIESSAIKLQRAQAETGDFAGLASALGGRGNGLFQRLIAESLPERQLEREQKQDYG